MTAPAGTGRAVTLQPGAAPVMLTEYAAVGDNADALQIINSNVTAGRVWISSDGAVSPSNGVPLDAGTSIPWAFPGQVWAVLDPAATAPVTLTLTSAVTDWTPSPAAIAAEVAAQLLAQGVPNVLTETLVGDFTIPFTAPVDVHGYASLLLQVGGIGAGRSVTYQFYADAAGTQSVGSGDAINAGLIPVLGAYFSITSAAGVPDVTIYGSNRVVASGHPVVAGFSSEPWILSFSGSTVAGAKVLLTTGGGQPFQGPAFAFLAVSSAIKGYWFARTPLNDALLVDTGQCHAAANGSTVAIGLPVALPANTQTFGFLAETTSAGVAISADLIPNY